MRQNSPLLNEGEFLLSTYSTIIRHIGLNPKSRMTAKTKTDKNTYPAVPKFAELAAKRNNDSISVHADTMQVQWTE